MEPTVYLFEDGGDVNIQINNLHSEWGLDTGTSDEVNISVTILLGQSFSSRQQSPRKICRTVCLTLKMRHISMVR